MSNPGVTLRLPHLTPRRLLRLLAGAAVAAAAAPLVAFGVRTMVAAWLAFPPPVLNPNPATAEEPEETLIALRQASAWAPDEATYPFMAAQVHQQRMAAHWLGASAQQEGEQAAAAASRALTLLHSNPFYSRLAGSIAIDRARHPTTPTEAKQELVAAAVDHMRNALRNGPSSPLLHQQAGLDLMKVWPRLPEAGRETALGALRNAVSWREGLLENTLATTWGHFPGSASLPLLDAITPTTPSARSRLGRFLESQARRMPAAHPDRPAVVSGALEAHRTAVEISDLSLSYLDLWMRAYQGLSPGQWDIFLRAARQLARRHPDRPEAHLAVAAAANSAGEFLEEGKASARATELAQSRFLGLLHDLGYTVADDGVEPLRAAVIDLSQRGTTGRRADPAYRRVEEAREIYATTLEAHARLLQQAGSPGQAVEAYRRLSALLPDQPQPLVEVGRSLDALGRRDEALESYREAVRVQPRSATARQVLAEALAERHEYLAAIEQWRTLLSRDPRANDARIQIARTLVEMGLLADAVREYADILERDPDNEPLRQEMDRILQRMQGR